MCSGRIDRHGAGEHGLSLARKISRGAMKAREKRGLPVQIDRHLSGYFESGQVTLHRQTWPRKAQAESGTKDKQRCDESQGIA